MQERYEVTTTYRYLIDAYDPASAADAAYFDGAARFNVDALLTVRDPASGRVVFTNTEGS
jgi:hypothetical protein